MALLTLVRPAVGGALLRRAAIPVAMLLVLAVLAGMVASMVVVIGLMLLYHALLAQGISVLAALSYTGMGAMALLIGVVLIMFRVALRTQAALKTRALGDVVQSFLDGFNTPQ